MKFDYSEFCIHQGKTDGHISLKRDLSKVFFSNLTAHPEFSLYMANTPPRNLVTYIKLNL